MLSSAVLRARVESSLGESLSSTLLLRQRSAPVTVPIGVSALDELTGGLPRGALSEIVGPVSSGRTGVMVAALAQATRRQEICALVDASDSFDPVAGATAGVDLDRLLWIRCCGDSPHVPQRESKKTDFTAWGATERFAFRKPLEQVMKVTDLLLQSGGFGMVVLDMGDIPPKSVRRVPLTSWFRFRRAVEPTATVLLLVEQQPSATTCASLVVRLEQKTVRVGNATSAFDICARRESDFAQTRPAVSHAAILRDMGLRAEVVRSWTQRKPPQSAGVSFGLRVAL